MTDTPGRAPGHLKKTACYVRWRRLAKAPARLQSLSGALRVRFARGPGYSRLIWPMSRWGEGRRRRRGNERQQKAATGFDDGDGSLLTQTRQSARMAVRLWCARYRLIRGYRTRYPAQRKAPPCRGAMRGKSSLLQCSGARLRHRLDRTTLLAVCPRGRAILITWSSHRSKRERKALRH